MLTHGWDRPYIINLPLRAELKAKAEAPARGASNPRACADASLYRRFHQVGLTKVKMFPQLATNTDRERLRWLQGEILPALTPEEAEEWRTAATEARQRGLSLSSRTTAL